MSSFNIRINTGAIPANLSFNNENGVLEYDRSASPNSIIIFNREASNMYAGCVNLRGSFNNIIQNAFSISDIVNADGMFYDCKELYGTPVLSGARYLRNIVNMFYNCENMSKLPSFHQYGNYLNNVTNMSGAFWYACKNLDTSTYLTAWSWIPDNCIDASRAFAECHGFAYINTNNNALGRNCKNFYMTFYNCWQAMIPENNFFLVLRGMANAGNMCYTFYNCRNIKYNISGNVLGNFGVGVFFDVKNAISTFENCVGYNGPALIRLKSHENNIQQSAYPIYDNLASCASMYRNCKNLRYPPIIRGDNCNLTPSHLEYAFAGCSLMKGCFILGNANVWNNISSINDNILYLNGTFSEMDGFNLLFEGNRYVAGWSNIIDGSVNMQIWFPDYDSYNKFNYNQSIIWDDEDSNSVARTVSFTNYNFGNQGIEIVNRNYFYRCTNTLHNVTCYINAYVEPQPVGLNVSLNHFIVNSLTTSIEFMKI